MPALRRWITGVAVTRIAFVGAVFVILELLCRFGVIDRVTMIPPSQMVAATFDILRSGRFNSDIAFTCVNTISATALAIASCFIIGAALHGLPRLRRAVDPLLSAYYAVPTFVFYPLLIVVFGAGRTALIVIGAMFGIVAMIINTVLGLDHVPEAVGRTGHILKLDSLRQLVLIRLPAAAPHLVSGIKLAAAYSVIGIVAGEFILATRGVGKRVAFAYDNFDNTTMYGLLLLLLVAVAVVNGCLSAWEKQLHRRFGQR